MHARGEKRATPTLDVPANHKPPQCCSLIEAESPISADLCRNLVRTLAKRCADESEDADTRK
eukprot:4037607-Pleurochrysis_carterae.AAC.1